MQSDGCSDSGLLLASPQMKLVWLKGSLIRGLACLTPLGTGTLVVDALFFSETYARVGSHS